MTISNVYAEVPAGKPDAGYLYEGPTEHMPRNISPAAIVGMPDALVEDVKLKNIETMLIAKAGMSAHLVTDREARF